MPDSETPVELSKYRRTTGIGMLAVPSSYGHGRLTLQSELHAIAQLGYGMDARGVPVSALQLMGTNAAVYLAERTVSGIVRRPDLYSVKHSDPKIRAEVEAWLWPLLPVLTSAAARGFAYGTVSVILDWERRTLKIMVAKDGGKARNKTLEMHTHFAEAHETHPDETTLDLDEQGRVVRVNVPGGAYPASRAHVWTWDPEFGSVLGQGARRRAWRPYCEHLILGVLRDKYLERSVDSPRVAFVPDGTIEIDGTTYTIAEYTNLLLEDLRGSGSLSLPGVRDNDGHRKYEVETLEIPDRADVWDQALNRAESEVFLAYLVSSAFGGLEDAGGAASRTMEGMLREHVEDLANWVAQGLTRIVSLVHRANHDHTKIEDPEIVATDVGKAAARKILQEVLRLANAAGRGELALRVDLPAVLDKLGVPLRTEAPEFPDGWGGAPASGGENGRPKDPLGDREDRRDDAATEEGEEDTGAPRDDVDGVQEKSAGQDPESEGEAEEGE